MQININAGYTLSKSITRTNKMGGSELPPPTALDFIIYGADKRPIITKTLADMTKGEGETYHLVLTPEETSRLKPRTKYGYKVDVETEYYRWPIGAGDVYVSE